MPTLTIDGHFLPTLTQQWSLSLGLVQRITVTFFAMVNIANEDDDDAIEGHGDQVTH